MTREKQDIVEGERFSKDWSDNFGHGQLRLAARRGAAEIQRSHGESRSAPLPTKVGSGS
jgi:hypothetical protein